MYLKCQVCVFSKLFWKSRPFFKKYFRQIRKRSWNWWPERPSGRKFFKGWRPGGEKVNLAEDFRKEFWTKVWWRSLGQKHPSAVKWQEGGRKVASMCQKFGREMAEDFKKEFWKKVRWRSLAQKLSLCGEAKKKNECANLDYWLDEAQATQNNLSIQAC